MQACSMEEKGSGRRVKIGKKEEQMRLERMERKGGMEREERRERERKVWKKD